MRNENEPNEGLEQETESQQESIQEEIPQDNGDLVVDTITSPEPEIDNLY